VALVSCLGEERLNFKREGKGRRGATRDLFRFLSSPSCHFQAFPVALEVFYHIGDRDWVSIVL
jgi:hypothetical protein